MLKKISITVIYISSVAIACLNVQSYLQSIVYRLFGIYVQKNNTQLKNRFEFVSQSEDFKKLSLKDVMKLLNSQENQHYNKIIINNDKYIKMNE